MVIARVVSVTVTKNDLSVLVYTKLDGKLATFRVETKDVEEARQTVQGEMSVRHRTPVLAIVPSTPATMEA